MTSGNELQPSVQHVDGSTVGAGTDSGGAFGPLSGAERRRLGRFAGVLMIVGGLMSLPAGLVLEPTPEPYEHLVGLGSAGLGVAVFLAPWERISSAWLHVAIIAGALEIAAGVAVLSHAYVFFYVVVAMFAAYVIRDRAVMLAYALLITLALLAPLAYADEDLNAQAQQILVTLPVLVIAAAIVRYLRDTLERRELQYRDFAYEAVSLAERIRGWNGERVPEEDLAGRLGRLTSAPPDDRVDED